MLYFLLMENALVVHGCSRLGMPVCHWLRSSSRCNCRAHSLNITSNCIVCAHRRPHLCLQVYKGLYRDRAVAIKIMHASLTETINK